jgi:hypothetical protein
MNTNEFDEMGLDEREWLAQERARLEARGGAASGDPMVARYRTLSQALRTPMPDGLPVDFAARVARLAEANAAAPVAEPDAPFERDLTHVLIGVFGLSAAVVVAMYGKQWLPPIMELLHLDSSVAVNWALAAAACVGATWLTDQLRRHKRTTHAA